jgi:YD repeat-containing protein
MKMRVGSLKIGKGLTIGFGSKLLQFGIEYKLTARFAALLLITALLSPCFLLKSTRTVSAASNSPIQQMPAPVSAPPEPFVLSSSSFLFGSITSSVAEPLITLNTFVSSGYSSALNYFTTPTLPEGFAMAKPSSPFAASVSSVVSSVGSILGFAVPSVKSKNQAAATSAASMNIAFSAPGSVKFDFTGDGKADASIWHPTATFSWKVKNSSSGTVTTDTASFTTNGKPVPADYDGDGITDAAMFVESTGTWTIKRSSDLTVQTITGFGQTGDKPVSGDYVGTGAAELAVWRPSNVTWYIKEISSGTVTSYQFGASSDIPVPGNYDGDGKMDYAVWRPSTGYWYIMGSQSGSMSLQWGMSSDIPVPGDYDNDGKTDCAVYRGGSGTWYAYKSSTNNGAYILQIWGNYGDQPVPADYDGDGQDDFAVWRPTTGVWYVIKSNGGAYQYQTLGMPGDIATPSAYLKQIAAQVSGYDLAKARLSPRNATGKTDLYSQNFSWGTGLVNLPGRAGMDMGFGMSYNSLVWTKQGATMVFDADTSNISPGFRFGFPTIEPSYYDTQSGAYAYLMVTPSGKRIEFKQVSASSLYETADSSYTQLRAKAPRNPQDPVAEMTITVTATDGTQMFYAWKAGAYRCTKIQDRNGNYIEISSGEYGQLQSVTDTLGRVVTVNYDNQFYPISITQDWKTNNGQGTGTTTHTYATFNYTYITVNPTFGSTILSVYGPQGGGTKVLQSVVNADLSSTRFDYNSFGQVHKVSTIAADASSHVLNYVQTNLQSPGTPSDCPRFTQTKSKVENFNLDQYGAPQDIVIDNTITENAPYTLPDNVNRTGTKIEVSMQGHPNSAVSKTYVGASGWQEGLPQATEDYADGTRKRWTQTTWTQDDTTKTYIINPRVTDTKVGDTTNTKRTHTDYITQSGVTLPNMVTLYDTNQTTPLKSSFTEYNWNSAHVSRRIIGLPLRTEQSGLNQATNVFGMVSKMTYGYDGGDFTTDTEVNQNITTVIKHDNTNYGASFIIGRGNRTSMTRWNVETNETVTSSVEYDIAGSPVAQITPGNAINTTRKVKIAYTDVFNDGDNSRNTFAYPTTITDPADFFSQIKYRFDIGTNVWAKSPSAGANPSGSGKETTREYDSAGRLLKEKIVNLGGAYTRYEYPSNGIQSKVFTTLIDNSNDGADVTDEVLSETWTDGSGRVRKTRSENPNSFGGYIGTLIEYDILGQPKRQTVKTEIDANWQPSGDDNRGYDQYGNLKWLWNTVEYDWKGRTVREINTDGTDRIISYEGCGCAGQTIITIKGEDIDSSPNEKRQTKIIYQDILDRSFSEQTYDEDGSIHTTATTLFNGLDQPVKIKKYVGFSTSPRYQQTTYGYDGFGRLKTKKVPEQDADKFSSYEYFADNKIKSATDARGIKTNYSYNNRGLLETTSYTIPDPAPTGVISNTGASYEYDALGNRTKMSDLFGYTNYEYDQLSRLKRETRHFENLSPLPNGDYAIQYDYELGGQLKSITDPFGLTFNSQYDKVGRVVGVNGPRGSRGQIGPIADYISNVKYRAWGQPKEMKIRNNSRDIIYPQYPYENTFTKESFNYDDRLRVNRFRLEWETWDVGNNQPRVTDLSYTYRNNNSLQSSGATPNVYYEVGGLQHNYSYDKLGRLSGEVIGGSYYNYSLTTERDVWGNTTSRHLVTNYYGLDINETKTYNFYNNRENTWQYDADGRVINDTQKSYNYNFRGQEAVMNYSGTSNNINEIVDGDGNSIKRESTSNSIVSERTIYIHSTVLNGEVLTEVNGDGSRKRTFAYAFGRVIAELGYSPGGQYPSVYSTINKFKDPHNTLEVNREDSLNDNFKELDSTNSVAYDPSNEPPLPFPGSPYSTLSQIDSPGYGSQYSNNCIIDGFAMDCGRAFGAGADRIIYEAITQRHPEPLPGRTETIAGSPDTGYADYQRNTVWTFAGQESFSFSILPVFSNVTFHPTDDNQKALDQAVQDVKDIFNGDSECSRFFEQAIKIASVRSTENGVETFEDIYKRYDATPAAESLGNQLRNNIGFLGANNSDSTTIGIEMTPGKKDVDMNMPDGFRYRLFDKAVVNIRGPFVNGRSFGSYSGRAGRALAILHEIAHLVHTGFAKDGTATRLIVDDKDSGKKDEKGKSQSERNTDIIEGKCKKELDKLK